MIGIVVGVRKKNKILLIIASFLYASVFIFDFGAYGIDIREVLIMLGELGIAIGLGLKLKKMWILSIILVIIIYVVANI